ncbi:VRR-NUC domain-containing protein [Achromobacter aegrifaciens]|uniref:VRR-NUC domain-containing protein n=1 Tax=Achromobacter aegrifaciens TaxID=1287736 RepID=UPI000F745118|nr:VRR-NUC domain-containing protein [Achromobacter aegrifaciens]RSF08820.1 VRR-NUC domain-containing protein [Achromobacter aegrifaciens]
MKRWPTTGAKRSPRASIGAAKLAGPSEDTIQAQVIRWATLQAGVYPELERLFHVPNGGQRHAAVAAKLKGQGVKAGVPDLCLPVPRFGCPGLWIEMKTADGRVSTTQKDWIGYLKGAGYRVEVCRSFDEARAALLDYLNPKVTCSPGII